MADAALPSRIEARGLMIDSRFKGNGMSFQVEGLAKMAEHASGYPFVIDHDMSVSAIAGVIMSVEAEQYTYLFDYTEDGQIKTIEREAVRLTRNLVLSESFPAYEKAARSILALDSEGIVPNTSISIQAAGIRVNEYDEFEIVAAPTGYRFIHDSHVSTGAFSHNEGVGLRELKFDAGEMTLSVGEGREVPVNCTVSVKNLDELVVNFADENMDKPELLERLGIALGLDAEIAVEEVEAEPEVVAAMAEEPEVVMNDGAVLNTDTETGRVETMADEVRVDNAPAPGEAPTPEAPAMLGANADVVNRSEFEAVRAELSAIRMEKEAAIEAAFASKVAELGAKHPDLVEKLAVCKTAEQLDLVAELAGRKSNPLPAESFRSNFQEVAATVKGSPAQAQSWHEARVAKLTGGV